MFEVTGLRGHFLVTSDLFFGGGGDAFLCVFRAEQCKVYFAIIAQITEKMWSVHVGM